MEAKALTPTDLLYSTFDGNFCMECESKVLNVHHRSDSSIFEIVLDRTVLYAQGGGQPTDHGVIVGANGHEISVSKVTIDRDTGIVTHAGELKDGVHLDLATGENVKVKVDEPRRQILSECHTAGHVVDSAMARCGQQMKPTKAYHFLDGPYVEYEGYVAPEKRDELLRNVQAAFCQLIEESIPTGIDLMTVEEADAVCNRQIKNFDLDMFADKRTQQVRVVTVAGFPCPCGGKWFIDWLGRPNADRSD